MHAERGDSEMADLDDVVRAVKAMHSTLKNVEKQLQSIDFVTNAIQGDVSDLVEQKKSGR